MQIGNNLEYSNIFFKKNNRNMVKNDKKENDALPLLPRPSEVYERGNKKSNMSQEKREVKEEKTQTQSNIITKPDGSRVLNITTRIGGMATTMSIKLTESNELDQGSDMETNGKEDIVLL